MRSTAGCLTFADNRDPYNGRDPSSYNIHEPFDEFSDPFGCLVSEEKARRLRQSVDKGSHIYARGSADQLVPSSGLGGYVPHHRTMKPGRSIFKSDRAREKTARHRQKQGKRYKKSESEGEDMSQSKSTVSFRMSHPRTAFDHQLGPDGQSPWGWTTADKARAGMDARLGGMIGLSRQGRAAVRTTASLTADFFEDRVADTRTRCPPVKAPSLNSIASDC